MPEDRGRTVPFSLPRRWIGDMLHFARRVPVAAAERTIRVRALADARKASPDPPTWFSLVTKGAGLVCAKMPVLRRAILPYPWPRLYEAPYSVASVVFGKEFRGETATFMCPLLHPERRTLANIQSKLDEWKRDPVEAHGVLRRIVRNAKPPLPVRRLLWAAGLYGSGYFRARNFGTFAVNSVAGFRGRMLQFQSPLTFVLYYGAVSRDGEMTLSIAFDHRVFDADVAARACSELESVFHNELLKEVKDGPAATPAPAG